MSAIFTNPYPELTCYDKIITRSEDWSNTIPLTLKGFVLVELSRLQEAIECYNKSLDLAPQWNHDHVGTDACKFAKHYATVTNLNYGLALDILGKQEAATKEYEKTIEYLDQELNSDNAECPNNVYYFLKAMTYSKLRKLKEANECYDKFLISISHVGTFTELYLYLEIYLTALKSYYTILDISDHQSAYVIKSQINHIWQDYEQEMKCYEKILELEPNNTTALYYMGMVCDTLGKAEEAVNYLEQLIKLDSMTHSKTEPLILIIFQNRINMVSWYNLVLGLSLVRIKLLILF
ncbi:tetratricopeptide repeat protein [Candidatus Tisiphia endosymbiont of Micropterix aruncella]|uniref:tetratricopeptide repeat protein n=1 Tax=Candidatus Tisiphia endosymbiont of Micropterix aruncella TaxID=3066271 RepID=UPI003AA87826